MAIGTTLIVVGCILAYFAVGVALAIHHLPARWERSRETWSYSSGVRENVQFMTWVAALAWPFYFPWLFVHNRVRKVVDAADPVQQERLVKQQQVRIAELERELGMSDVSRMQLKRMQRDAR